MEVRETDWQSRYARRHTTADEAVRRIPGGSRIFIGSGAAVPQTLVAALAEQWAQGLSRLAPLAVQARQPWSDPRITDGLGVGSCHGRGFEVDGAEVAEGRVAAGRVVERFDPVEHRLGEPGSSWPLVPVEEFAWPSAVCLVIGNEVAGVTPPVLEACPHHVSIRMRGVKDSLNVAVAFGIVAHHAAGALERAGRPLSREVSA